MSMINSTVRPFSALVYKKGAIWEMTDQTLKGKWSVVVFYPGDFTPVCATEIEDFIENYKTFADMGVEIYGCSIDSVYVHQQWMRHSHFSAEAQFPLIGDTAHAVCKAFDVFNEAKGCADRSSFVVAPDLTIKMIEINDSSVGRNSDELRRKIEALQYLAKNPNHFCPAKWTPSHDTLRPSLNLMGKI